MDDDDDENGDTAGHEVILGFLNKVLDETMQVIARRKEATPKEDHVVIQLETKSGRVGSSLEDVKVKESATSDTNGLSPQIDHADVICSEPVTWKSSPENSPLTGSDAQERRLSRRPFYLSLLNPFYRCCACVGMSVKD